VNPDHLFLGTIGDNTRDMYRKGRAYRNQITEAMRSSIRAAFPYESGAEIGRRFGVPESTVQRICKGLSKAPGYNVKGKYQPAYDSHRALTPDQVRRIRALYQMGRGVANRAPDGTIVAIAAEVGAPRSTINAVAHDRSYCWVRDENEVMSDGI